MVGGDMGTPAIFREVGTGDFGAVANMVPGTSWIFCGDEEREAFAPAARILTPGRKWGKQL